MSVVLYQVVQVYLLGSLLVVLLHHVKIKDVSIALSPFLPQNIRRTCLLASTTASVIIASEITRVSSNF